MMKLYHRPDCPFCWKVRIFLNEADVEVDEVVVELGKTHPDVAALNPNVTVPVLVSGDLVLYESEIIIEYLVDKFPQNSMMSGSPEQRAIIRQLQSYSDKKVGKILFPFIKKVRESTAGADIEKFRQDIAPAWTELQESLSKKLATKAFFVGEFSVADCALIPRVGLAVAYGLTINDKYKNLENWFSHIIKRPSFLKTKPDGFMPLDEMIKSQI